MNSVETVVALYPLLFTESPDVNHVVMFTLRVIYQCHMDRLITLVVQVGIFGIMDEIFKKWLQLLFTQSLGVKTSCYFRLQNNAYVQCKQLEYPGFASVNFTISAVFISTISTGYIDIILIHNKSIQISRLYQYRNISIISV